jgi:hypothetical protein
MIVTGIGVSNFLTASFEPRAQTAPDGSEALALWMLDQKEEEKTLSIAGTIMNRTDSAISGLVAVIIITDRFTLPAETVTVPIDPAELAPKGRGNFQTTVTLGEKGLGGYSVQFQLPQDKLFVPQDERQPNQPLVSQPCSLKRISVFAVHGRHKPAYRGGGPWHRAAERGVVSLGGGGAE